MRAWTTIAAAAATLVARGAEAAYPTSECVVTQKRPQTHRQKQTQTTNTWSSLARAVRSLCALHEIRSSFVCQRMPDSTQRGQRSAVFQRSEHGHASDIIPTGQRWRNRHCLPGHVGPARLCDRLCADSGAADCRRHQLQRMPSAQRHADSMELGVGADSICHSRPADRVPQLRAGRNWPFSGRRIGVNSDRVAARLGN